MVMEKTMSGGLPRLGFDPIRLLWELRSLYTGT